MKVLKFGGTSVSTAENILKVKAIVERDAANRFVVVSAFGGVTNQLIGMTSAAQDGKPYVEEIEALKARHIEVVKGLKLSKADEEKLEGEIDKTVVLLTSHLDAAKVLKEASPKTRASITSFGERLSALIISHAIVGGTFLDSRNFIVTDAGFEDAEVDFTKTNERLATLKSYSEGHFIMPGFIAANEAGETTTLGRGGSDYTASIVGAGVGASTVEIWTDVDGVLTTDPREVSDAYTIDVLTFDEMFELASCGAKVLHPPAIWPLYDANIPMYIKNTFNPDGAGTLISDDEASKSTNLIKGLTAIKDISLLTLQGSGMAGVHGTSERLFGALAKHSVSVILISQVSSEQSITFAIDPKDKDISVRATRDAFKLEFTLKTLNLKVESEMSIIAVVGEGMKHMPGISGRFLGTLGKNAVNVVAIAQGSSELNISAVVKQSDLTKALNVVHEIFFYSDRKKVHVYLAGIGTVGGRLLAQLEAQHQTLLETRGLDIRLVGVMNSRKMLFNTDGLGFSDLKEKLDEDGQDLNLAGFVNQIDVDNLRNRVFIDCTANDDVASLYEQLLESYVSVITANKIATSASYDRFLELKRLSSVRGVKFLFETNVAAGLPVIRTLEELTLSGDKVLKIEGVLSGTLNFIFNTLSADIPLSRTIEMAKEEGYSEPDSRLDLSGTDVMRKILILARVAGYAIEPEDVAIETFLPDACFDAADIPAFFDEVKKLDADFESKRQALEAEGKRWRFVATLENGKASLSLIEVDETHAFYHLQGTDNVVTIYTERYRDLPMIIKGAGAGSEVTAAGVFGDLIKFANL